MPVWGAEVPQSLAKGRNGKIKIHNPKSKEIPKSKPPTRRTKGESGVMGGPAEREGNGMADG
jgi:hypothetical protein